MPTSRPLRFVLLSATLLAPMLAAGCSDGGGSGSGPTVTAGAVAEVTLEKPEWRVGDSWNYTASDPGVGAHSMVVFGEEGDDWVMETDNPVVAYFNTRFDSSMFGAIRKSDLAGSQGDVRVEYFRWPLEDGKSWLTTWDGFEVNVTAALASPGVFAFQATRPDGSLHATYTYDAEVRWFGEIHFYENGTDTFAITLDRAGPFAGEIVRWHLDQVVDWSGRLDQGAMSTTFAVEPDVTDVYIELSLSCGSGFFTLAAGQAAGPNPVEGTTWMSPCPIDVEYEGVFGPPVGDAEETWGAVYTAAPTTQGEFTAAIFKRTLERLPVAAG